MKNKTMLLSTLLCLTPILLGIALYDQLPDMVPTHFNIHNEPDGWSSKPMAVFGIPLVIAALNLVLHWAAGRDEKMRQASPKILLNLVYWITPFISLFLMPVTLFMALGKEIDISLICSLLVGIMFVVVGNYLPKCKPNLYMGIKLPWTYASEENWHKTHRFGGKVWVVCGFLALIGGIFQIAWLLLGTMFAAILLPCLYSYLEYKREEGTK